MVSLPGHEAKMIKFGSALIQQRSEGIMRHVLIVSG